jgi:hypothetical protein
MRNDNTFHFEDGTFSVQPERKSGPICSVCSFALQGQPSRCVRVNNAAGRDCAEERLIFVRLRDE